MTIKQRGANKIWQIEIMKPDGTMYRQSARTTDKKVAQALHDKLKVELKAAHLLAAEQPAPGLTLQQGFDKAMRQDWRDQRSHETVIFNFNRVLRYIPGETPLSNLTVSQMWDLVEHLREEELADSSINRSLAVVSKILHLAKDRWEMLDKIPKVPKLKESSGRFRWLQPGEEELITTHFKLTQDEDMLDLIPVYLDTGCRRNEILELQKEHLLVEHQAIQILNAKTAAFDVQPLTRRAFSILKRRAEAVSKSTEPLFTIAPDRVSKRFLKMRTEVFPDDTELCVHSLRHTTASRLVLAGVDIRRIQKFMRHDCITTTLRYAKLNDSAKADAARVLEGFSV